MGLIVGSILPVFGLILLGYVCGRTNLLGEHAFQVLNRFVLQLTLPVLTFHALATIPPGDLAAPELVAAVSGGAAAAYALAFVIERLCRRGAQDANIVALSASYSNTAFIGLPICLVALGAESLGPATLVIAVNSSIIFGFGVVMCELLASAKASLLHSIRVALVALARNPLVAGSVLGIGWSFGGLPMPDPLEAFTRTLGGATAACALVAIGLFIARPAARGEPIALSRTLVLKLAVQPLATLGMLYLLPPLPTVWSKTAILLAAMPTGTSSFLLAASFSPGMTNFSARAIVLSTLASVGTLSLVLVLLA